MSGIVCALKVKMGWGWDRAKQQLEKGHRGTIQVGVWFHWQAVHASVLVCVTWDCLFVESLVKGQKPNNRDRE